MAEQFLSTNKSEGKGTETIQVTGNKNEGKDRSGSLVIKTAKNTVVRVSVNNPGLREELNTADGTFSCSDASEFLILKS